MLILVMLVGILSGCSSISSETENITPVENTESAELKENEGSNSKEWPKTITDVKGNKIVLEKKPERITLLSVFYVEHFLALGVQPTAVALGDVFGQVTELNESELFAPYLKSDDIMNIGKGNALNLEKIIQSKPDVIITFSIHRGVDEIYDQLSAIAPVVLLDYTDPWDKQLSDCAEIVGKTAEADTLIKEIQEDIAKTKSAISKYTDRSFALFRTDGKTFISRALPSYYEDFGLVKPKYYPDTYKPLSLEGVAEMNPYYIVFQHNYDIAVAFVDSMKDSSVWQSLDAVKNNRVYYFDDYMNTMGPLAMKLTAKKLLEIYTQQ